MIYTASPSAQLEQWTAGTTDSRCDSRRADRLEGCAARTLHAGTSEACTFTSSLWDAHSYRTYDSDTHMSAAAIQKVIAGKTLLRAPSDQSIPATTADGSTTHWEPAGAIQRARRQRRRPSWQLLAVLQLWKG